MQNKRYSNAMSDALYAMGLQLPGSKQKRKPKKKREGYYRTAWEIPAHCANEMRDRAYQWKPSTVNKPEADPMSISSIKRQYGVPPANRSPSSV